MPYFTHYIILLCDRAQGNRVHIPEDGEDSSGNFIMYILWREFEESKINLVQTASYIYRTGNSEFVKDPGDERGK